MRFLSALITTFLLACTGTLALKLPEGYHVIEVIPIDPEYMYDEAKDNPNVPLINATLSCGRDYAVFFEGYDLEGYGWYGVSKEQIMKAAKAGGLSTGCSYEVWEYHECLPDDPSKCKIIPGWRIYVSVPPNSADICARLRIEEQAAADLLMIFGGCAVP
jgi:hypothetical protein